MFNNCLKLPSRAFQENTPLPTQASGRSDLSHLLRHSFPPTAHSSEVVPWRQSSYHTVLSDPFPGGTRRQSANRLWTAGSRGIFVLALKSTAKKSGKCQARKMANDVTCRQSTLTTLTCIKRKMKYVQVSACQLIKIFRLYTYSWHSWEEDFKALEYAPFSSYTVYRLLPPFTTLSHFRDRRKLPIRIRTPSTPLLLNP